MKKIVYIVALLAMTVGFASCSRDEKDLFDRSAAERVQDVQDKLKKDLLSAPNGWEMLYFPQPDRAGYAFLCRFQADGSVVIAAKNKISSASKYAEETSLWATYANQGAVLSFNSFNNLFHAFSDPGSDGVGYEGDYEFVVIRESESEILLKGKKHAAYITMRPLPVGLDWKDYFKQIDYFNEILFDGNDGIDMSYCNGDTIYKMTYEDGVFTYQKNGEDIAKGFIITPNGLSFYSGCPMTDSTVLAKNFVINDDQTRIVSIDQPNAFFASNYSAADFFALKFNNEARWIYSEENSDAATVAAVNAIKQAAAAKGANITRIAYDRYQTGSTMKTTNYDLYVAYSVEGKVFEGRINLNYSNKNGIITFSKKNVDATLNKLLQRIDADTNAAAQRFVDVFCDAFEASSYNGSSLNMMQLYLKSATKTIHVIADKDTK